MPSHRAVNRLASTYSGCPAGTDRKIQVDTLPPGLSSIMSLIANGL